jgi:hypothetical protein
MDNIITMRSDMLTKAANELWVDKPQKAGGRQRGAPRLGAGLCKRKGVYWFNNKKVKDLVAFCRKEGLIVAPDANRGPND